MNRSNRNKIRYTVKRLMDTCDRSIELLNRLENFGAADLEHYQEYVPNLVVLYDSLKKSLDMFRQMF